jgi:hypothetical protein
VTAVAKEIFHLLWLVLGKMLRKSRINAVKISTTTKLCDPQTPFVGWVTDYIDIFKA